MVEIIHATENHIQEIQRISTQVWPVAYADVISQEQIDYMLDMMYSDKALRNQFAEGVTFLLALENETANGFAAFQKISNEKYKLYKLYVLTSIQTKGVGTLLLQKVIEQARLHGGTSIELQVNKKNKARFFYEKMGFVIDREEVFDIGNGYVMDDYIMVYRL